MATPAHPMPKPHQGKTRYNLQGKNVSPTVDPKDQSLTYTLDARYFNHLLDGSGSRLQAQRLVFEVLRSTSYRTDRNSPEPYNHPHGDKVSDPIFRFDPAWRSGIICVMDDYFWGDLQWVNDVTRPGGPGGVSFLVNGRIATGKTSDNDTYSAHDGTFSIKITYPT